MGIQNHHLPVQGQKQHHSKTFSWVAMFAALRVIIRRQHKSEYVRSRQSVNDTSECCLFPTKVG